jgi:hypothetical protein
MTVSYTREPDLTASEFIDVLRRSTLAERRPIDHPDQIEEMLRHASIIVTACVGEKLVGVSRRDLRFQLLHLPF